MNHNPLSAVKTAKSTYDLFGTLMSPRNNPGLQAKKRSVGRITAGGPQMNPGMTVRIGSGHVTVGTPDGNSPMDAGINKPSPRANVTRPFFVMFLGITTVPRILAPSRHERRRNFLAVIDAVGRS